jgi:chromosome segregation ATPase
MEPIIATEPNSGSQIEQVQVFLESARSLIAQEGSSLLHTLLDRVKHLEIELQDKNKIMDGCKHFNKELSVANSSLEAREKDNLTKFSEIMTECENLRSTNLQTEKELQAVLLEKQSSESKLEIVRQKLKAEKETTKQLRDTVNEKDGTLATRSAEVELLRKSEQTLIKHCKKADQDISQIQRFTTKLQDEDQDEMLVYTKTWPDHTY